jgi:hypothetical protein
VRPKKESARKRVARELAMAEAICPRSPPIPESAYEMPLLTITKRSRLTGVGPGGFKLEEP